MNKQVNNFIITELQENFIIYYNFTQLFFTDSAYHIFFLLWIHTLFLNLSSLVSCQRSHRIILFLRPGFIGCLSRGYSFIWGPNGYGATIHKIWGISFSRDTFWTLNRKGNMDLMCSLDFFISCPIYNIGLCHAFYFEIFVGRKWNMHFSAPNGTRKVTFGYCH